MAQPGNQQFIGTPREREILDFAAEGFTDKEIAGKLGISRETVATYWKRIRQKLGGSSRTEAVARALKIQHTSQFVGLEDEKRCLLDAVLGSVSTALILEGEDRKIFAVNRALLDLVKSGLEPSQLIGSDINVLEGAFSDFLAQGVEGWRKVFGFEQMGEEKSRTEAPIRSGGRLTCEHVQILSEGHLKWHLWMLTTAPECSPEEEALAQEVNLLEAAATACAEFVVCGADTFDETVDSVLKELGEVSNCDRSYVFIFSPDHETMTNTHEWTAPGISAVKDELIDLPIVMFTYAMELLRDQKSVVVDEVSALGQEASMEKDVFTHQGIVSVAFSPILSRGKLFGFIGLDCVKSERNWSPRTVRCLEVLGISIGGAIDRCNLSR